MRRLVTALLAVAFATALASPALAAGNATDPGLTIFKGNCAGCHTLAAAKAKGTFGPNLDKKKPKLALIVSRVTNGKGGMPSFKGKLKPTQISAVAKWVSTNYKK